MLTRSASTAQTSGRAHAIIAALVPTGRVARPALVALTVALAGVPALLTIVLDGDSYGAQLILLGLVSGASLGWATDDPAAELLASTPIGAPIRTWFRTAAAALVAGIVLVFVLAALAIGPGLAADIGDRLPEAAAAGAAALALGLLLARRGERAPGAASVVAGVMTPAFVAALSVKLQALPTFSGGTHHGRWWLVALAGVVVAVYAGRDPVNRLLRRF